MGTIIFWSVLGLIAFAGIILRILYEHKRERERERERDFLEDYEMWRTTSTGHKYENFIKHYFEKRFDDDCKKRGIVLDEKQKAKIMKKYMPSVFKEEYRELKKTAAEIDRIVKKAKNKNK